jgi:hypothetical protein
VVDNIPNGASADYGAEPAFHYRERTNKLARCAGLLQIQKMNKLFFLVAVLGFVVNMQASQELLTDLLGQPINTDQGGGNQHQGCNIYNGLGYLGTSVDLARITVARSAFSNESYVVIWQGPVVKNQPPPANAIVLPGSDTTLAYPPPFVVSFSDLLLNHVIPPPVDATTIYSIAIVDVDKNGNIKTNTSAQFGFPYLNSQLQNTFNITTQLGSG